MATKETIRSERREEARRRLGGYRAWVTLNDQTLRLIESIESRLFSVTAQMGETNGSGDAKDAMADNIATMHEQAEKLREQSKAFGEKLDTLLCTVCRVAEVDPLAGQVLALRYMELSRPMDFNEIAERLGYSHDHMVDKHRQGLEIAADVLGL